MNFADSDGHPANTDGGTEEKRTPGCTRTRKTMGRLIARASARFLGAAPLTASVRTAAKETA